MEAINLDGDEAQDGLLSLVIAVVELLVEALEAEAIRRMKSGSLTDEEIERLGTQLAAIHEEVDRLKTETGVEEDVDRLRTSLSDLVEDALERVDDEPHPGFSFLENVRAPDHQEAEEIEQSKQTTRSAQTTQSKRTTRSAQRAAHRPPVRMEGRE